MADDAFLEAMGLSAFPETLFIDAQGRVAEHLRDGADLDYFAPRVEALLRESAAPEGASTKASPLITPSSEEAPSADRGSHGIISRLTFRFLEWRKR